MNMKVGLVLEGGAMRGMYTAGVLDVFLENGIEFDGIIGVSAGAIFGVNFLSKQKGRVIRYNKRFNGDKNYLGLRPLIKTGNIVDTELAYHKVPRELDIFDDATYMASKVPFYAVVTNIETGEAEYKQVTSVFEQMDILRASASMPFLSRPVIIDGKKYLDGAIADSIPFEKFKEMGYDKLVVVLTKDKDYVKKPMSPLLTKVGYGRKYPKFEYRLRQRYAMYNETMERLKELEQKQEVFVVQPSQRLEVGRIEKDPDKLQALYDLGIKDAQSMLEDIKEYLKDRR